MNIHVLWLAEQAAKESKDAVDAVMTEDGKKVIRALQEVVKTANEKDREFRTASILLGAATRVLPPMIASGAGRGLGRHLVKPGGRGLLKAFMKNDAPKLPKDNFDVNRLLEAGQKPPKLPEQHRIK